MIRLRGTTIDFNSAEVRRDEKPIHLTPSDELPNHRAQEIVKVHVRRLPPQDRDGES
ncbi:MAG: hypothetical protein JO020_32445 [Chloroflexi bacterium]|nr:hypothetical protein [Chloroflexota bacterium]